MRRRRSLSGSSLDDLARQGANLTQSILTGGQNAMTAAGTQLATNLVASSGMQPILDEVQARAQQGVVAEVKKNAIPLGLLAITLGAVGGAVLKGRKGVALAALLGGGAIWYMTKGSTSSTTTPSTSSDPKQAAKDKALADARARAKKKAA